MDNNNMIQNNQDNNSQNPINNTETPMNNNQEVSNFVVPQINDQPTMVNNQVALVQPEEKKKDKKWIIIIIIIIVILLLLLGSIFIIPKLKTISVKQPDPITNRVPDENGSNKKTTTAKKTNKKCGLEGDHIHISDLTDEEFVKYKISFLNASVTLYRNSAVKSIIFDGKEYDYQEVLSLLDDFDKMTTFILDNTDYTKYDRLNETKDSVITELDDDLTIEDVVNYVSTTRKSYNTRIRHEFYILDEGEVASNDSAKKSIELEWNFNPKILQEQGDYYIADRNQYKHEDNSDYNRLYFSVDGYNVYADNINFGFVLNDGRFVHMLTEKDVVGNDRWLFHRNIFVQGSTATFKSEKE